MKNNLEQSIKNVLAELNIECESVALEHPAELVHGDYSTNVALSCAKAAKQNPRALAEQILAGLQKNNISGVEKIEIAGPGFINFHLSKEFFIESVREIGAAKDAFGKTQIFNGQTWAIEYASPNPNKAMHLGHLRNVLTGVSLCNILEANGAHVIREMVDNNRGIAIAKLMWGYLVGAKKDGARIEDVAYFVAHENEWQVPADRNETPDRFVDTLYVAGAGEYEADPLVAEKVKDLVVRWEAKDENVWKLWEKVLSYAYDGQKKTLDRLGAHFDYIWHEHEHYQKGKDFVEKGLAQNVFKKLDDGAILSDLEKMGLTDTVVVKKDGTALYITQDLALTDIKKKKHNADKMIWIIGPEQSLAMQQLFAICEQLGIGMRSEFVHVAYGYMSIKGQGKMSSRKGNVMYLDDVLDEAKERIQAVMKDRVPANTLEADSEKIAHAAITLGILKAGRMTDIAFDLDEALRLEGDTGPYLEYSAVRARSLVQKARKQLRSSLMRKVQRLFRKESIIDMPVSDLEKYLYRFPEVVAKAGTELSPSTIANYLIELAGLFNGFYAQGQIIDQSKLNVSMHKVAITEAFAIVMKNGLNLLGISVPEKM